MAERIDISDTDQVFLDLIFDRALERLEDGLTVHPDLFLEGRLHLREQVEELIRLAEQTVSSRTSDAPVLPGYSILSELGRGGMGAVYLARQEQAGGRAVALKVLPALNVLSPRARQRFLAEAHTLAQLRHPHIVTVYDVVETGDAFAYSMEWVDGATLAEVLRHLEALDRYPTLSDLSQFLGNNPPASPLIKGGSRGVADATTYVQFVCRLGIAVGRALEAVHNVGLVHRDVKPSNILLRRDGTPLLSDFGLVREVDSTVHSQSGHFVGTAAYASPEQLHGDWDAVDGRSDVYSLGVTLYHAITLNMPFHGAGPVEMIREIERGAAMGIRRAKPALPKDLETIVSKAMDPDPVRRFATAGELADDLERLLNLQPIRARPAGPVTRTVKYVRRNRKSFLGAVAGSTLALTLAAVAGLYAFWLPRWVDQHVTDARLQILNPAYGEFLYVVMYLTERQEDNQRWHRFIREGRARYATALQEYDTVLWASVGRSDRRELLLERDTVSLAIDVLDAWTKLPYAIGREASVPCPRRLSVDAAAVCKIANHWATSGGPRSPGDLPIERFSVVELRLAGLLAFLCGDAELCSRTWERLDMPPDRSDALVDAALGQLYLTADEPHRAYPRLDRACRAFTRAGYLIVDLADVAVRCGDLRVAERLLERAKALTRHDPFDTIKRVWADFYAARNDANQGDVYRARDLYEWMLTNHSVPTAYQNYARFLQQHGDDCAAAKLLYRLVAMRPELYRYRESFVDAVERCLRKTADSGDGKSGFSSDVLRSYEASLELLGRGRSAGDHRD